MDKQLLDLFVVTNTFTNFINIGNENTVAILKQQQSQFTHLRGSKQSGKTHLLMAWVNLAHTKGKTAIYLNCANAVNHEIATLNQKFSFIALDNIEQLNSQQQIDLFNLFNNIKLHNLDNLLLTSSTISLTQTNNLRQDLKTRLLSGLNLSIKGLTDEELTLVIKTFTQQEGIHLESKVQQYLITHYTRNIGSLISFIEELVQVGTLEQRHISIPLIKQVLSTKNAANI